MKGCKCVRGNYRRRRIRAITGIAIAAFILVSAAVYSAWAIGRAVYSAAYSACERWCARAANYAASTIVQNMNYSDIVTVSRADGEGSYIEIDSSSVAAGAFSCAVLAEDEFRRLSGGGVDVNALAVIGLSGLTEKTAFKAYPVRGCSVSVQFYNDLVSCGINSVMHTLFYCLQFTAEVAHDFSVRQFYFDFSVPVVQSIIYGTIPEIYVR